MSHHLEDIQHEVSILFRCEIENQRWKSKIAQRRRGNNSAFEARGDAIMQHAPRRARRIAEIVGNLVEETLHAGWRFQPSQFAQFSVADPKTSECRSRDERPCRAARELQAERMSRFKS